MTRLNIVLLAILIACALGLISAQHQARKLFTELAKVQGEEKQLEVEWGQLQLEQSTWATHARVEKLATQALDMRVPEAAKIRTVNLEAAAAPAAKLEGRR
jgi:cell division protein FtsL